MSVPGALEDLPAKRHEPPDMVPGREFGHHAPIGLVHRDLGVHGVREQLPGPGVVDGKAGFVAGGLDAEDQHGVDCRLNSDRISPFPKYPGHRKRMPTVRIKENEPFEVAMRRFKRTVEKTGLLTELRAREFYEKPTTERKRKLAAAVKRHHKRLRSQLLPKKMY